MPVERWAVRHAWVYRWPSAEEVVYEVYDRNMACAVLARCDQQAEAEAVARTLNDYELCLRTTGPLDGIQVPPKPAPTSLQAWLTSPQCAAELERALHELPEQPGPP